ncbi:hypothetical protein [Capsulimonas corticalis]|uniref:hypothetical protein n=1 Tax=Capsulimonas corticalis TaxID=2219043 RepID=UPI000F647D25|nr:hypothetical protein [Capsulimonas corticalis]
MSEAPTSFAPPPAAAPVAPIATPAASTPPVVEYAPPAPAPIATAPSPVAAAPVAAFEPAPQSRPARRPAKRRRSSESTEIAPSANASMDVMMQHILELAQKVEAAASKVEAVADKAEATNRPSAEDGVMVPTRTTFSRPAPQSSSSHTGSADPAEAPIVPPVVSDPGFRASATIPIGQPQRRSGAPETMGRDSASGLVTLEHEMSIPKVAPFILEEARDAMPSQSLPELRPVESAAPELLLTKTQDEPRPQGAPIVLRSQKSKDPRAVNDGR